jgi:hypothetical protein
VGASYITTDLDLRARFDLSVLNAEFETVGLLPKPVGKRHGLWCAGYSCPAYHGETSTQSPAETLKLLLQIVEGLTSEGRDLWDNCVTRRFDMGFMCSDERFASNWQINPALLQRVAAVKGDLVITIYRVDSPCNV